MSTTKKSACADFFANFLTVFSERMEVCQQPIV
jgi:hypothetical protein